MSTRYLLDTNICVYLLRGKYRMDEAIDNVGLDNCYISEITAFELKVGAELSKQRDNIDRSTGLEQFLSAINILPITNAIDTAAKEKIRLRLCGTPLDDDFDLIIGSTAVSFGMVMVTENIKDFKNIKDIKIENWVASCKSNPSI